MATYAIAQTGGKQYKVAPGDIVKVEKLDIECGTQVTLPVVLVVDGATVITQPDQLTSHHVCAEVIDQIKGPKIRIHKFKNKTGYHKRQGHRQRLTVLKIITIS